MEHAALVPPRAAITSGGRGLTGLTAALAAQPGLVQTGEDRATEVAGARTVLRGAAAAVDRLNKRFYSKLHAEARTHPGLATALERIPTDSANLPATLGLRSVVQGGRDGLQVLLIYDNGSLDGSAAGTLEWMVVWHR